jgi:hypothetical protein
LLNGGENVVEKPNPTDVEVVTEKLKNGKLKVVGSNPKSKPKAKEATGDMKPMLKKQNPESKHKTAVSDQQHQQRPLVELNEENFLKAMRELGGKNVTTSQLWPYFISADTKPQQRFPVMHRFARKMEKAGKITITTNPERKRLQYMYTLTD